MNSHEGFQIKEGQIDVLHSNFSDTRVYTNTCNCEGSLTVKFQTTGFARV